jgi:hypothetical protein
MSEEPFDISKFVKSAELNIKTGFTPDYTDDGNFYFHEYKPPPVELNLTFETDADAIHKMIPPERHSVMKWEHRGKYWFDYSWETYVYMKGIELAADGNFSATCESTKIIDKTNYGKMARFLRWILRRKGIDVINKS